VLHMPVVGAVAVSDGAVFSDSSRSVFLTGPDCSGNESSISDCPVDQSLPCSTRGGVGVICQGNNTKGQY